MERILTPTDFAKSMSSELHQIEILFSPNPDFEPEFRNTLNLIFNDLELIDTQDSLLVSSYLDSIAEPLSQLRKWGIQIVAVKQKRKYHTIPMVNTIYYIAPDPCYFQSMDDSTSLVHKLGVPCETGNHILSSIKQYDSLKLKLWFSRSYLQTDFENNIPWCSTCLAFDSETKSEYLWITDLQKKILSDIKKPTFYNDTKNIKEEINQGENERQEFKQTLRVNIKTGKKDPNITHAVLKTICAFLNTSGGILFIGVADDKTIVGISQDGFESEDRFQLHLTNEIKKSMGSSVASNISISIENVDGKNVCRVLCVPSKSPIFLNYQNKESFYIRIGNQTVELSPRDLVKYLKEHFNI
jgi:hypothetical protein